MNKIIIAFTAGVIVGLLYAPAKGKDTREKIANLGNDFKDGWNSITDSINDKIGAVRDSVDNIADKAAMKVERTQFESRI